MENSRKIIFARNYALKKEVSYETALKVAGMRERFIYAYTLNNFSMRNNKELPQKAEKAWINRPKFQIKFYGEGSCYIYFNGIYIGFYSTNSLILSYYRDTLYDELLERFPEDKNIIDALLKYTI